ncbi:MAG TPA: ankyrin repeat domain-containing protein [Thermoplasmata archaeon]|nr:ankyrin repeat domain-containing protein [Thermoplasmata archaeon]
MTDSKEFFDAVRKGDATKVDGMLAKDRNLLTAKTDRGFTAVTVAAYMGGPGVLKTILAHQPAMTVHEAALAGDLKRVKELVEKDPKLANDASSPDGFPPLGLAAFMGRADVVAFLLANGADLNFAAPGLGFTALTGAVNSSHPEVVKILVKAGADPNYLYEEGAASVMATAAANGNVEIVRTLLDAGADPNVPTKDGKTPLAWAVEKGHHEVAEMLRRHGARN